MTGNETGDGITVRRPEKAAPVQIVTIEYLPAKAGELNKKLVLQTDSNGLTATVTVEGKAE